MFVPTIAALYRVVALKASVGGTLTHGGVHRCFPCIYVTYRNWAVSTIHFFAPSDKLSSAVIVRYGLSLIANKHNEWCCPCKPRLLNALQRSVNIYRPLGSLMRISIDCLLSTSIFPFLTIFFNCNFVKSSACPLCIPRAMRLAKTHRKFFHFINDKSREKAPF